MTSKPTPCTPLILLGLMKISGFPQEVQQEETPAAKPVVEENVAFPILIGIP